MINSCDKGKRGERKAAEALTEVIPGCEAVRGRQYKGSPTSPDVVWKLPIYVETKWRERISLPAFMKKLEEDSGGDLAFLMTRSNRQSDWFVTLKLSQLVEIAHIINEWMNNVCDDTAVEKRHHSEIA